MHNTICYFISDDSLKNRFTHFTIDNFIDLFRIEYGLQQGCFLSPYLFIIESKFNHKPYKMEKNVIKCIIVANEKIKSSLITEDATFLHTAPRSPLTLECDVVN